MSWAILHDLDNLLRAGGAEITSAPTPAFGSSIDALTDGVQAIPCYFLGVQPRELVIGLDDQVAYLHLSLHDLWVEDGDFTGVSISWAGGSVTFTAHEVHLARGSVGVSQAVPLTNQVTVKILPTASNKDWSLSELCIGWDAWRPSGGTSGMTPPRSVVQNRTWNTVTNGPWRTKLAEPVEQYVLSQPAGKLREGFRNILARSEGGLRPVSFMPKRDAPMAILAHLGDEFSGVVGLGDIWEEGVSMTITEQMRVLR